MPLQVSREAKRARDVAFGIERERRGDLAPRLAERGGGARADQLDELVRRDGEAAVGIHLPDEAQRRAPVRPAAQHDGFFRLRRSRRRGNRRDRRCRHRCCCGVGGELPLPACGERVGVRGFGPARSSPASKSEPPVPAQPAVCPRQPAGPHVPRQERRLRCSQALRSSPAPASRPPAAPPSPPASASRAARSTYPCRCARARWCRARSRRSTSSAASAAAASGIALSALERRAAAEHRLRGGRRLQSAPWPEKIASASSAPASSRFACSASESFGPAASVATTRIAGVRSASMMRAQLQSSAPPKRPPNPRSRSSRGAAPCGSVPASRAICSAAEPLGSIVWPVSADGEAALKIAAAVGLPHRMRVASALHSHAGTWLVAYSASRGSLRNECRDFDSLTTPCPRSRFFRYL